MDTLDTDYPGVLLESRDGPCISIYLPTHRHHPDKQQDPIRFRNQVKRAEAALRDSRWSRETDVLIAPFHALAEQSSFWNHTLDGLAVLGAPGFFRVYRLQRTVPERTIVADSFHTKPLLRIVQSADRFQVLALSRGEIRLFQGNRVALDEVELAPGVPRTLGEALGEDVTEPHRTIWSAGTGPGGSLTWHGSGSRKDEVEIDDERFFRADDLLDDIGEAVLRRGGEVVVVPAERMPTTSGLAATYRY